MNNKIIIILLSVIYMGCTHTESKPADQQKDETTIVNLTDAQIKNAGIETGVPETRSMNSVLKLSGMVEVPPQSLVSVSFPLGGYLKTTQLLPGMPVKQGENIAILEDQSFIQLQQDYLISKTKLQYLQQEADRQRVLNESKANSDKVLQQTEADLQSQKILVKGLYEKLQLIGISPDRLNENNISRAVAIHSPITGFVSKVNVNIGKYVTPTDVLFELVNPDDIHAALTVFEKDISQLKIGQKVTISLVDKPQTKYEAKIILISKSLDENRSATIHCHFEKEDHSLLPGMFLNAFIETSNNITIAVPDEAVVRYANKFYVFEEKAKNQFEIKEVEPGVNENGYTEIKNNSLIKEKRLVIKNAYAILSKMKNKSEEE